MDRTQRQVALFSNSLSLPSGLFYLATQGRSYGCNGQVAEPPTLKILRRPLRQLFYKTKELAGSGLSRRPVRIL